MSAAAGAVGGPPITSTPRGKTASSDLPGISSNFTDTRSPTAVPAPFGADSRSPGAS